MRTLRFFILSFLICWISASLAADDMPIIAYWGVPEDYSSEAHFQTFKDCGFTVSLYPYSSLTKLKEACKIAEKKGISIIGNCPEQTSTPQVTAKSLKEEKAFYGYLLQDEPDVLQIKHQQQTIERLKAIDSQHIFYLNLYPLYNADWIPSSTKAKDYPDYVKTAARTDCQQISFDHYPITTNGVRETWYQNLEMIRQESLSSGKPFWGFALSIAHNVPFTPNTYYPIATLASLRLQIYTNLAYGAQAIQYFTYWHPGENDMLKFHDAPISRDGKKTKTYYVVQKMNQELKPVARLFYGAKVTAVHHLGGTIPEGGSRLSEMPKNLSLLKVVGRQGATISQFTKNGRQYLAIVNKSPKAKLTIRLKTRNQTPRRITKKLQAVKTMNNYTIQPGDILLFRLT